MSDTETAKEINKGIDDAAQKRYNDWWYASTQQQTKDLWRKLYVIRYQRYPEEDR